MTEVSYPQAEENWSVPQWRVYHARDTGILGSAGGSDRQVYVDGSGPYFKRLPGARYIQGIYGADDETWTSPTVTANTSGQPRIDRVVDQLNEDGTIETVVVTGTPSTTPTPPTLTQVAGGVWQEHLAYGRVKAGFTNLTSTDAQIVDERRFMPVRVVPVTSESLRDPAPRVGDEAVYPDGRRERWTGSGWLQVATPPELWTPAIRSNTVTWSLDAVAGSKCRVNGYVEGWSYAKLSNNGPAFQPGAGSPPPLPTYATLPYPVLSGYRGPAGTWGYVTEGGAAIAAGELVVGYDGYGGGALLVSAVGPLYTSNQWAVHCQWRYPAGT